MERAGRIAASLPFRVDLDEIVVGRARLADLTSNGRISANGSCRLLAARDGWVAVNLARREGLKVARGHLHHLNPFPANLGDVLARFERVLVPEMNAGQLCREVERILRATPVSGLHRYDGEPLAPAAIAERASELVRETR